MTRIDNLLSDDETPQKNNAQPDEVKHYLDDYFEHFDCADCIKVDALRKNQAAFASFPANASRIRFSVSLGP